MESTDQPLASEFKSFNYTDYFEDRGTGYSFKLGAIIKPIETFRIGLAFHSPTWYRINEYFFENITSNFTYNGGHYDFSNDPQRFRYALATPFRALAGIGVQIKKIAILSADYEFVDYRSAKFSQPGDNFDYTEKNDSIKNTLKSASNIRLGGELRLNKLYLRSGYSYYGKPFHSWKENHNLSYRSVSFGAGYRERNFSLDFAYTRFNYSQRYILYPVNINVEPALAHISNLQNMFTLTLALRFGN